MNIICAMTMISTVTTIAPDKRLHKEYIGPMQDLGKCSSPMTCGRTVPYNRHAFCLLINFLIANPNFFDAYQIDFDVLSFLQP